ncbi:MULTISPECIES: argininosuccinate synthase-related protein [unclassified Arthrobacter]|uniref:argininosuccinate synthase-related protein n=1 Tax=unclassified Arthrobacter TaxID=235627 RepID=UPI0018CAEAA3
MTQLIRSFAQLENASIDPSLPIVTLFSGGLDSTYLLYRLQQLGARNVHAVSIDVGDIESHTGKSAIAEALGASFHSIDARQQFVDHHVAPAIRAHAVYLNTHPISSSLSRPLIARIALEIAAEKGASLVLHTANRSQNSLRRLNGALKDSGFTGSYGSPYDLDPINRATKIHHLAAAGLSKMSERVVSGDSNLWCREYESGFLDDPENHAMEQDLYLWTKEQDEAPRGEELSISFEDGLPVRINGERLPLLTIIEDLNERVGKFGYGRYSGLEHLDQGEKVLEVREMPAAWIILRTLRHLETACLDQRLIRQKIDIEQTWVTEAVEGRWFGRLREAAQAFIDHASMRVNGTVTWKLSQQSADTVRIIAAEPLYLRDRDTWEEESVITEKLAYAASPLDTPRREPAVV